MSFKIGIIPVTPFQQNCTLVWDDETKSGAVIDPGGDVSLIKDQIDKLGLSISEIFLTHGHIDHAGGAGELSEQLDARIVGPGIEDKFLLDDLAAQGARYGLKARDCHPDRWLQQGDIITMGGEAFQVRHCPGHTPGHMVFLSKPLNFGIVGDVLFRGSVGRTDLGDYGDHEQLIASIQRELLVLPDEFSFLCGHGTGSTIGAERQSNPFL
ncbi:MBL fold metallo-hydrolase [Acidocella aminolytica]|uniref:Metallo-beta-lactamase n=1 Tax=Acidocella aminolytica 101 = DSM 11237 TaxID=1120923 RepID=A0A0D6PF27_9PROT|nr:MBL fold metallo-hydrolase [Acidocella aminolytica]GAN79464.1 metallo-beta-lactamase [Acidocella aminolytica 101 = DSM 11237]GBQ33485.1 metallo-beta-lactamase [Acidocella aminolytica 101 = DSM 11237]SHE46490.1 Glyoxylase, beta-lactamase superfamily II [Acidocella aminolytica 101 = DSM 11237]